MSRLPPLDEAALTPEQRTVFDSIQSSPRGKVEGPLRTWLTSPGLAERAQALGAFCRYGSSLPARLSELAIITTGAYWKAGFEWHVHAPLAVAAGLDPAAVEALRTGATPHFEAEDEQAVWRFAHHLLHDRQVSEATYRTVSDLLGPVGVVDLVGVMGYYGLISMTIKAFEVPVPDGAAEPFA